MSLVPELREPVVSKSALFKTVGYVPHSEEQWQFHKSTARFKIPCCGRRWGKSFAAGMEMAAALFIPDAFYWICGPTYKLGEKEFRVVSRVLKKMGLWNKIRKRYDLDNGKMWVEMPWNTRLEVVSSDKPESLQGEGLAGVIMAESASHPAVAWDQYIEPTLMDFGGWAILPSTPKGKNWYYYLWKMGQHPDGVFSDYQSWRFPTWTNTARFPQGFDSPEIQRMLNRPNVSKAFFDQEIAALFTAREGLVYGEFNRETHVRPIRFNPMWRNFWAMDFGYTNPTVVLDIMVDHDGNFYVWREYYESQLAIPQHMLKWKEREDPAGYRVDGRYGDPRAAGEIATMALEGLPVITEVIPESQGIELVKRLLMVGQNGMPKLFIDPSCIRLIDEFETLEHKKTKIGDKNPSEQINDKNNHGTDALRYIVGDYFVLGMGESLADLQDKGGQAAETYFSHTTSTSLLDELRF
jgi:hypothetical protein